MQLKWRRGWFKGVALQASGAIEAQAQAVADSQYWALEFACSEEDGYD